MDTRQQWIVTVDGREAHLFSCQRTRSGGFQLDQVRSLENMHEREHSWHRPSMLGGAERRSGRGHSSASVAMHTVAFGHEVEEEQLRFVRDIKHWLQNAFHELDLPEVTIFALPRFIGLLREELGESEHKITLRRGELTHLSVHDLAICPAVRNALERSAGT